MQTSCMYYLSVEMRTLHLNTYVTCSGSLKLSMAEVGFELCVFDIEALFYSWHKFQHWERAASSNPFLQCPTLPRHLW